MIEGKFFNLLGNSNSQLATTKRCLISEVRGYFDLCQAILPQDAEGVQKNSLLISTNGLSAGFKEILGHIIKMRDNLEVSTIRHFLHVIKQFLSRYKADSEYHQTLFEAAQRVFSLEHLLTAKFNSSNRASTGMPQKLSPEVERIRALRVGLTDILIKAYSANDWKSDFDNFNSSKHTSLQFVSKVMLEIIEEEPLLSHEDNLDHMEDHKIDRAVASQNQSPDIATPSIYKFTAKLISDLCSYKQSVVLSTQVFKIISQKYTVAKLLGSISISSTPSLCSYYQELLMMIATAACQALSEEMLAAIFNQICIILSNKALMQQNTAKVVESIDQLLSLILKQSQSSNTLLLTFYKSLINEYVRIRVNENPFDELWVEVNRYLMAWVSRIYKQVVRVDEFRCAPDSHVEATMKFWIFVIIDLKYLVGKDLASIRKFSLPFTTLIEQAERKYSNSFLTLENIVQQELPVDLETNLDETVGQFFEKYQK